MTWEYKHFNSKLSETELNNLGKEGWELVSHTAIYAWGELKQYYVFKRPRYEQES